MERPGSKFPYISWERGQLSHLVVTGLPQGVVLKRPSGYSRATMQAIVNKAADLKFGKFAKQIKC